MSDPKPHRTDMAKRGMDTKATPSPSRRGCRFDNESMHWNGRQRSKGLSDPGVVVRTAWNHSAGSAMRLGSGDETPKRSRRLPKAVRPCSRSPEDNSGGRSWLLPVKLISP